MFLRGGSHAETGVCDGGESVDSVLMKMKQEDCHKHVST